MKQFLEEKKDKINYLKGLIRIAKVDGVVEETEKDYYLAVAMGLELNEKELLDVNALWGSDEKIKIEFSNIRDALFFVQGAIQISMVDGTYDVSEREEIRSIACELSIDIVAIESIEKWVEEGLVWRKKGEDIIDSFCS